MKSRYLTVGFCSLLFAVLLFASCTKDDSKLEYGFTKIYMPQGIVKSGGVNNQYPVPSGTDSSTWNYRIDKVKGTLYVFLGSSLTGSGREAYSAQIKVNNDTIQGLLNAKIFDPSAYVLMPATMYSLPTSIQVGAGIKDGFFSLSIDYNQLKSATYTNKFLLLAVKLDNPTTYELNKAIGSVILVIDVKKIP